MDGKQFVRDYLSYSRRERVGLLVLIVLNLLVFLLPAVVNNNSRAQFVVADTAWIAVARRLQVEETNNASYDHSASGSESGAEGITWQYDRTVGTRSSTLFYFDPNTLSPEGWEKLGVREKTVQTVQRYLAKGGRFHKTEDLKKVYGIREADYERLAPYVRIEIEGKTKPKPERLKTGERTSKLATSIDVNTADTVAFIALPGIGSKLAARIVGFREKLGGFYSIEQLKETYGLPDSTFQKIRPLLQLGNASIKKININTATIDELKAHPYIRYNLAKPIVAYRSEHGPFATVEGLRKVMAITGDLFEKISPYLTVQ